MVVPTFRPKDIAAIRRGLLAWHRRHALQAPWRASGDPYQALVAAVMAQQTQMSRVLPKFEEFTAAFPTVEALAAASTADVLRAWAGLGYNLRALRLQRAAQQIVALGGFPKQAAELQRIDGIGPFTAAIVASFAFGEPVAAVDTNVERVVARLAGDVDNALPRSVVREGAGALVARRAAGRWNQAMMDLGALVCTVHAPKCDVCPLARWCRGRRKLAHREIKAAEARARYRAQPPYRRSRRYYRGRIVDALRALPPGRSLAPAQLLERVPDRDGLDERGMAELVESLRRDGLVRVTPAGRVRLP
jgi:A/G-specific adenine glycosylase